MAIYLSAFARRSAPGDQRFEAIREVDGRVRDPGARTLDRLMTSTPVVCRAGTRLISADACRRCRRFVNCVPDDRGHLTIRCLWSDEDPVGAIMTPAEELIIVMPQAAATDSQRLAERCGVHHLIVAEDERFVGLLCRCDLVGAADAETVGERAVHCPWTVEPRDTLGAAARLMRERRIGCLPVVEDRQLVGLVTRGDLMRAGVPGAAVGRSRCPARRRDAPG